jgi:hypothetical protein
MKVDTDEPRLELLKPYLMRGESQSRINLGMPHIMPVAHQIGGELMKKLLHLLRSRNLAEVKTGFYTKFYISPLSKISQLD